MDKFKRETGYTLIGVLLIFTIVSILGVSLVSLSVASVKTSTKERDNQSAYYVAEAGLNYQLNEIEKEFKKVKQRILNRFEALKNNENYNEQDYKYVVDDELQSFQYDLVKTNKYTKEYKEFHLMNGIQPEADFKIKNPEKNKYTIISTGYIGAESRKVAVNFQVGWDLDLDEVIGGTLPPFAVFTNGQFTLSNGSIIGNIGTVRDDFGIISFPSGGPSLEGDIYVPGGDSDLINNQVPANINSENVQSIKETYTIPELPDFPAIPIEFTKLPDEKAVNGTNMTDLIKNNSLYITNWITDNYTLEMKENLEFNSINIAQNNTLYIDVGDTDKELVVNKLNIQNGHIKLVGSGSLTIYIKDEIVMGAGSHLNEKEKLAQINIFYAGNKELKLTGDQKVYGSIYANQANLDLSESGGVYGNIFTKGSTLKIGGGSDIEAQLILAPYANIDVVAGGNIKGRVITKSFNMEGGGKVLFVDEPFITNGPISPSVLDYNYIDEDNKETNIHIFGLDLDFKKDPIREKD